MTTADMPDTIWTYDEKGNRLRGRPNFDKPGVAEAVERAAFYGEIASCANRGVSVIVQMARANRFEDELKERTP